MMEIAMILEMMQDPEEVMQRGRSRQAGEPRTSRAEEIQVRQVLDNNDKLEEPSMQLRRPQ